MDPVEIVKIGALGPVCGLLMWLLIRADKREEKQREEFREERAEMLETMKSMINASSVQAEAMRGVQGAVETLKIAFSSKVKP